MIEIENETSNNELMELERILKKEEILTVFQPIVELKNGNIIGYEGLSRGPVNSPLYTPDKLFKAAEENHMLWDLELLCRVKAIERARNIDRDKYLFINVDPYIFKDEKFKKGFTKEFLARHNMSPETIIFEITEKTCIEDYKTFNAALTNYTEQGYKIAIDDTGSGYSGLKMLSETKPQYIKIDMDLIRDIDKDFFKQELIKSFVSLSEVTMMKLIAEGIETKEELLTLIDLGVYAGQGFYLQRPAESFLNLPDTILHVINKRNRENESRQYKGVKNHIGQIARKDKVFSYNSSCNEIKKYMEENKITGACIVNNNFPVGLVMRHDLDSALATQYGVAVFSRRPISLVMNKEPLIVDFYDTVNQVSKAAMERCNEYLYDYVIVTKDNKYYGVVTIRNLLEYTTKLEYNYAKGLNPLTGLPGNTVIEEYMEDMRSGENECTVLYFDLDNFKVYNDTYGFENGDKILKYTGDLIQNKVKKTFPYNSFIGHIGGDDFVCVIQNDFDKCKNLCEDIIEEFDKEVLRFFNEKDKENGYIEALDRKGALDRFSLTSISIAGIHNNLRNYTDVEEISKDITIIKKSVKSIKGSSFFIRS